MEAETVIKQNSNNKYEIFLDMQKLVSGKYTKKEEESSYIGINDSNCAYVKIKAGVKF
jgi:hypothetical protein